MDDDRNLSGPSAGQDHGPAAGPPTPPPSPPPVPPPPSPPPPQHPYIPGLVSRSLQDGWVAIKRDPILLIGLALLIGALTIGMFALARSWFAPALSYSWIIGEHPGYWFWRRTLEVLAMIVHNTLSVGLLYACLRVLRGEQVPFGTFFSGFRRFVHIVIVLLILQFAIGFGILFLIVPGIVIALGFSQWPFLIMDRNADCIAALRGSWQMMRGYKADYFLLWLALIAINLLALIPLGLGLFLSVPFTYAAQAAFYRHLAAAHPPRGL